jgi:DNA modification methylase
VLHYSQTKDRIHITEKPIDLLKRLIELSTNENDLVFDPFAGSASTLVAAMLLKRKALGTEVDTESFEWSLGRLKRIAMEDDAKEVIEVEEAEEETGEAGEATEAAS